MSVNDPQQRFQDAHCYERLRYATYPDDSIDNPFDARQKKLIDSKTQENETCKKSEIASQESIRKQQTKSRSFLCDCRRLTGGHGRFWHLKPDATLWALEHFSSLLFTRLNCGSAFAVKFNHGEPSSFQFGFQFTCGNSVLAGPPIRYSDQSK